jgi:hypothetical protein
MKILILLCLGLLFTACAVIDTSVMDSAVPIYPDIIQTNVHFSTGLDLSSAVVIEQLDDPYAASSHDQNTDASMEIVNGYKVNFGINERTDVIGRFSFGTYSMCGKIGVKLLLDQKDKFYWAVAPMLTIVRGEDSETIDGVLYENKFNSQGFEIQGLITHVPGKHAQLTAAARINGNFYDEYYRNRYWGPYQIYHGGLSANLRLLFKPLIIGLEVGTEIIPVIDGETAILPHLAIGVGLGF